MNIDVYTKILTTLKKILRIERKTVIVIWLIFAILYGWIGYSHWQSSKEKIEPFEVDLSGTAAAMMGVPTSNEAIKKSVNDFNTYLEKYNESTHKQNIRSAKGYFLASALAIFSMFLGIVENRKLRREIDVLELKQVMRGL